MTDKMTAEQAMKKVAEVSDLISSMNNEIKALQKIRFEFVTILHNMRSGAPVEALLDWLGSQGHQVSKIGDAALTAPRVLDLDRDAYEQLREIIDGGSESMTHADAVEWCKDHAERDEQEALTAPRVPEGWLVMRGKYGIIVQGPEGMITEQVRSSKQNLCFHDPVIYQFLESVLTTAPAPADSDPMPMPLFTTTEGEEINRLLERVKKLEDVLHKMIGVPASAGFCEPIEGYVNRPHDAVDVMREMAARLRGGSDE